MTFYAFFRFIKIISGTQAHPQTDTIYYLF